MEVCDGLDACTLGNAPAAATEEGAPSSEQNAETSSSGVQDPDRFYCPYAGCNRSFAELWRLKVHYRALPDVRGSGKERGHGAELDICPKCRQELKPGKHHVGCSAGKTSERQSKKPRQDDASPRGLDIHPKTLHPPPGLRQQQQPPHTPQSQQQQQQQQQQQLPMQPGMMLQQPQHMVDQQQMQLLQQMATYGNPHMFPSGLPNQGVSYYIGAAGPHGILATWHQQPMIIGPDGQAKPAWGNGGPILVPARHHPGAPMGLPPNMQPQLHHAMVPAAVDSLTHLPQWLSQMGGPGSFQQCLPSSVPLVTLTPCPGVPLPGPTQQQQQPRATVLRSLSDPDELVGNGQQQQQSSSSHVQVADSSGGGGGGRGSMELHSEQENAQPRDANERENQDHQQEDADHSPGGVAEHFTRMPSPPPLPTDFSELMSLTNAAGGTYDFGQFAHNNAMQSLQESGSGPNRPNEARDAAARGPQEEEQEMDMFETEGDGCLMNLLLGAPDDPMVHQQQHGGMGSGMVPRHHQQLQSSFSAGGNVQIPLLRGIPCQEGPAMHHHQLEQPRFDRSSSAPN